MKTIFIDCNDQLDAVFARVHRGDDPPIVVNTEPFERAALPHVLDGYDICVDDHSYMPTELVAQCPALKHIVFLGTGASSYMDVPSLNALGVTVHTIKGYGDIAVAEHTIALMFSCARELARMDRDTRSGRWVPREGTQLHGKTLGVIGLGGIGRGVARIARGIGMEVIAWNRTPRLDAGVPIVNLDTLLARADVVSLNLALNDETRGIIDAKRIAHDATCFFETPDLVMEKPHRVHGREMPRIGAQHLAIKSGGLREIARLMGAHRALQQSIVHDKTGVARGATAKPACGSPRCCRSHISR